VKLADLPAIDPGTLFTLVDWVCFRGDWDAYDLMFVAHETPVEGRLLVTPIVELPEPEGSSRYVEDGDDYVIDLTESRYESVCVVPPARLRPDTKPVASN
jgi:hypothetical protein